MAGCRLLLMWMMLLCVQNPWQQHGGNLALGEEPESSETRCMPGWTFLHEDCYLFVRWPMRSWDKAREACKRYGAGLASIGSEAEYDAILEHGGVIGQRFWVALTKSDDMWWWWSDDGPFDSSITSWRAGEPNNFGGIEKCGEIFCVEPSTGMNDSPCQDSRSYICEKQADDSDCSAGLYGQDCSTACSDGCSDNVCYSADGQCQCKENWKNDFCTECADGMWGPDCSLPCGHCAGDGFCDTDTGHCSDGCQTGWTEMGCSTYDGAPSNSPPNPVYITFDVSSIVTMVTALSLLAISVALIVRLCCDRRRRQASNQATKAEDVERTTCPSGVRLCCDRRRRQASNQATKAEDVERTTCPSGVRLWCDRRRRQASNQATKAEDVERTTCPSDGEKMADSAYDKVAPGKVLLLMGQKVNGAYIKFDNGAFTPDA